MSQIIIPKTYVRTNRLAELTGIPKSTWEKRRLTGDTPPFLKIGKTVVYELNLVHEWLTARLRSSTSDTGASR